MMVYTGRLPKKGLAFSGFRYKGREICHLGLKRAQKSYGLKTSGNLLFCDCMEARSGQN